MQLKVVVEKPDGVSSEPSITFFNEKGGTIGRREGNDLRLLNDPSVSSEHANIRFESGRFFLEDVSTNGTYKIEGGKRSEIENIPIQDGDIFIISDFFLKMEISDTFSETPVGEGEASVGNQKFQENSGEEEESIDSGKNNLPPGDLDVEDLIKNLNEENDASIDIDLGNDDENKIPGNPKKENNYSFETLGSTLIAHESTLKTLDKTMKTLDTTLKALDETFREFLVNPPHVIDKQYPPEHTPESHPDEPRVNPVSDVEETQKNGKLPSVGDSEIFKKLLESLGVVGKNDITEENMLKSIETVGKVLRELIDGLMILLRARTDVKSMFGIDLTVIEKKENNPLKFLPTVEEVIKLMFLDENSGYMNAIKAVTEAHRDLRNHQIAMNTGTNKLVGELVKSFDPEKFEKKHEKGFVFQKKAKCWLDYKKNYEATKQRVFEREMIDVFVKEYQDVIYKYQDVVSNGGSVQADG